MKIKIVEDFSLLAYQCYVFIHNNMFKYISIHMQMVRATLSITIYNVILAIG